MIFSKSRAINILSTARLFLFGARDIWFVIALPVFLSSQLGWDFWRVGGFLASWIIGYGVVQSLAPMITAKTNSKIPDGRAALWWAVGLAMITGSIAIALSTPLPTATVIIIGLFLFGAVFAINSSLHSYLIVSYAKKDGASLDVGFYYMANAMGRLIGTLLSGWIYQHFGFTACLWVATVFILSAALVSVALPYTRDA